MVPTDGFKHKYLGSCVFLTATILLHNYYKTIVTGERIKLHCVLYKNFMFMHLYCEFIEKWDIKYLASTCRYTRYIYSTPRRRGWNADSLTPSEHTFRCVVSTQKPDLCSAVLGETQSYNNNKKKKKANLVLLQARTKLHYIIRKSTWKYFSKACILNKWTPKGQTQHKKVLRVAK